MGINEKNEWDCFDVYKFATGYLPDEGCVEKEKDERSEVGIKMIKIVYCRIED